MKLENIGKKLADKQIKSSGIFMIALALLLVVTIPGIPLLLDHIEPSLEKIMPQDVQEVRTMNDMRAMYGADMMYLLIEPVGPTYDIRDPDVVTYMDMLANKLREREYILEITSLPDLVKEVNNNVIPDSNDEIRQLMSLNPRTAMYVNHDYTLALMQIRSDTGATASVIKETVDGIRFDIESLQYYNPGVSITITGFNAIDKATFEVILQDFVFITGFSFLFMSIFLLLYFKSIRKVIGALAVIMISVLVTLGLTGYLNITVTVVTMVAAAMIMALGISYGINVTYDYYLQRKKLNKQNALRELNSELIRALVGSSLTTSAGFLALLFGVIPAMKNLGTVLAMGIIVTLAVSIIFLPVIIYKLDKEELK